MLCTHRAPQPGRKAPTLLQIANPIWLLGDVNRPAGWTWWDHFKRNPCANLHNVVIGVAHLEHVTVTTHSPWTWAVQGWNMGWTVAAGWRCVQPLPFISHRGFWGPVLRRCGWMPYVAIERMEFCIGWKTSGTASITYRRANSPNQDERP